MLVSHTLGSGSHCTHDTTMLADTATFMLIMMNHTTALVVPSVMRSSVIPNDVLLQTAPRKASDVETLLRRVMVGTARGGMAERCSPKPRPRLMVLMMVSATRASWTEVLDVVWCSGIRGGGGCHTQAMIRTWSSHQRPRLWRYLQ
jgi:hypothetical protein